MNAPSRAPVLAGIYPTNLDEVARFSKMAVMSGLQIVPKKRSDDEPGNAPGSDRELATATMVILQGLEVGLPPMQALQTISLINGRPLIWGDAVPALLWRAGFKLVETMDGSGDQRKATCRIIRPDGVTIERSFSVADAKRARLWDERQKVKKWGKNFTTGKREQYEAENDSPWFRFPDRMLQMRARGFAVKDGAPDVTRGLYLREEYEANEIVPDAAPEPLAIEPPDPDVPALAPPAPEDVVDPAAFVANLRETIDGAAGDRELLAEIAEHNAATVATLPNQFRQQAEALLKA